MTNDPSPARALSSRGIRHWTFVIWAAALLAVALGGCGGRPDATAMVERSQLQPGQGLWHFELETARTAWAESPGGWCRLLLSFPLSGSKSGRPVYCLYLRFRPIEGIHAFSAGGNEQALFVHLSRSAGELNQLWLAQTGQMGFRRIPKGNRIQGSADLSFADGTHLSSRFKADYNLLAIEEFERDYLQPKAPPRGKAKPSPASRPGSGTGS